MPDTSLPVAFVNFDPEYEYAHMIKCPESCERCRACWNLKALNKNVLLSMKRR